MKRVKSLALIFFLILITSCQEPDPFSPMENDLKDNSLFKGENVVKVMTRNIYVGTDVDRILMEQDPNQIPIRVAEAFQTLLATNFPERAEAFAREIYENQPHLIGLQEVSLIRMQSPGDAVIGGTIPAEEVVMDYLEILLKTLEAFGLEYDVVAKVKNIDVEMPMIVNPDPLEFSDVRLTDYDVILAKRGIQISSVVEKNYKAKVEIAELGLVLPRGYTAVTAEINNVKFRFVNTHLEDADEGGDLLIIQKAQAAELLLRLSLVRTPVILVGDFNSAAPDGDTYKLLTYTNRYKDTWLYNIDKTNLDGYTYGHDLDLLNPTQNFWKRIDYVFVRNGLKKLHPVKLDKVNAEVLGDEPSDKTSSGLWPSDHGGIAAELNFKLVKFNNHKRKI